MKIRIDLKIIIFIILFYITKQIDIYIIMLIFCLIHELGHILVGIILKMKPDKLELMPYGLKVSFKVLPEDLNKKIKKGTLLEIKKNISCFRRTNCKFNFSNYVFLHRTTNSYKNRLYIFKYFNFIF